MNSKDCVRSTKREQSEKDYLMKRLNVIEGQVRGVASMIDADRYCDDILIQISAINNSLNSISNHILKSHLATCVPEKLKNGDPEIVDEIMSLIERIRRQ